MQPERSIISPEAVAPSPAGRVELTRELFDSRMRNVAFSSWDELLAALADKPSEQGYSVAQGGGGSVIRLDPKRIFGWTAILLVNICNWGLIGYSTQTSTLLGFVLTAAYGIGLWQVVQRSLVPELAGVLWPIIPATVAVACLLLAASLMQALGTSSPSNSQVVALSLLCIFLQTAVACLLLRGARQDPDRATLVLNVIAGADLAVIVIYANLVGGDDSSIFWSGSWVLLLSGLASIFAALRLLFRPGDWGSGGLVSWTLNLGALEVFASAHLLLELPSAPGPWRWLVYLLMVLGMGVLGAVSDRSFPTLLAALGLAMLSWRAALAAAEVSPKELAAVLFFLVFGVLGMAIVGVGQWLQRSGWRAKATMAVRHALARAFGSDDLADDSWRRTARQPLNPREARL